MALKDENMSAPLCHGSSINVVIITHLTYSFIGAIPAARTGTYEYSIQKENKKRLVPELDPLKS